VDEVYSTEVQFVGDDLYNRGNLRDMVHTYISNFSEKIKKQKIVK